MTTKRLEKFVRCNEKALDQLSFVLTNRSKPVVVILEIPNKEAGRLIRSYLEKRFNTYQHDILELQDKKFETLDSLIKQNIELSDKTASIRHIIHLYGLENHLFSIKEGKVIPSDFLLDFNLARERIFRNINAALLFYLDKFAIERLQKHAPDLWDWVNYHFRFEWEISSPRSNPELRQIEQKELPQLRQKEIEKRIKYLEARLEKLQVADDEMAFYNTKISLLWELARLYNRIRRWNEAEKKFREALHLQRILAEDNPRTFLPDVAATLNNLANLHSDKNDFTSAEAKYEEALQIRRSLAEKSPDAYLPDVAMTLVNLSIFYLQAVPDKEKSVALAREVLEIADRFPQVPAVQEYAKKAIEVLRESGVERGELSGGSEKSN